MTDWIYRPDVVRLHQDIREPALDAYALLDTKVANSDGSYPLPISPFDIANSMGVKVFSADLPSGHSGFTQWKGRNPEIYINRRDSLNRQRFTCAHELGHIQEAINLNAFNGADRDIMASQGISPSEVYANRYAAAMLMPAEAVRLFHGEGMSISQLAVKFKVSTAAMEWRLKNLGIKPLNGS